MDLVHVVRHKVLVEGRTQRAVARELGLARVTVRKYVAQAAPTRKAEGAPRPRDARIAIEDRSNTNTTAQETVGTTIARAARV